MIYTVFKQGLTFIDGVAVVMADMCEPLEVQLNEK